MPLINQQREERPVERERVYVETGGIYLRVFHKNAQRAGSADEVRNQLG